MTFLFTDFDFPLYTRPIQVVREPPPFKYTFYGLYDWKFVEDFTEIKLFWESWEFPFSCLPPNSCME